jgi:hypothetical protein
MGSRGPGRGSIVFVASDPAVSRRLSVGVNAAFDCFLSVLNTSVGLAHDQPKLRQRPVRRVPRSLPPSAAFHPGLLRWGIVKNMQTRVGFFEFCSRLLTPKAVRFADHESRS